MIKCINGIDVPVDSNEEAAILAAWAADDARRAAPKPPQRNLAAEIDAIKADVAMLKVKP